MHLTKDAEADAWEILVIHGYGDSRYQYLIGFYSSLVRRNAYDPNALYAKPNSLAQGVGFTRWLGADSLQSGPVTHDLSHIQTSANMGKISATVSITSLPHLAIQSGLATRRIDFLSLPSFY